MEDTMIEYTKEDLKVLAQGSSAELAALLEDMEYDPEEFEEMMRGLPKDHKYLFEMPIEKLFEHIDNPRIAGYFTFRMAVGK